MSLQDILQRKIDKKNIELEDLRNEKAAIENKILAAEVYVEATQDAIKSADKSESAKSKSGSTRAVKAGSSTDKALHALRRLGKPTHVRELLEEMDVEVTKANLRNVASSLSQSYRIGRLFTRPESQTFGLLEWGDSKEQKQGSEDDHFDPDLVNDERDYDERFQEAMKAELRSVK